MYRQFLRRHGIMIVTILLFMVMGIYYVYLSARDIVFMDFWRNVVRLVPQVMENKLSFKDLWEASYGQRNVFQALLFALNIRYLGLNCIWEAYGGIIAITLSATLVYAIWDKLYYKYINGNRNFLKQVVIIPVLFMLYSLNQWEILSLEFSFAFMIRVFAYLFIFKLVDIGIIEKEWNCKFFFKTGIFAGIVIVLLSQLYFPAMLMAILSAYIFSAIFYQGSAKDKGKTVLCYFLPCITAVIVYFWKLPVGGIGNSNGSIKELLVNGTLFFGILYMLTGSVLHQSIVEKMNMMQISEVGLLLLLIVIAAVIIYFKTKLYKHSFFPVMVVAYGMASMPIIIYGRIGDSNLNYLTSSRYTCETTLIWVGCGMIFAYGIAKCYQKIIKASSTLCLLLITILIIHTGRTEFDIAPYRGYYKDELLKVLEAPNAENGDDKTLASFQAPTDTVRAGIQILKQYKLNIYSDSDWENLRMQTLTGG